MQISKFALQVILASFTAISGTLAADEGLEVNKLLATELFMYRYMQRDADVVPIKSYGDHYYAELYNPGLNRSFAVVPGLADGQTIITPFADTVIEQSVGLQSPFKPQRKDTSAQELKWFRFVPQCKANPQNCQALLLNGTFVIDSEQYFGLENYPVVYKFPSKASSDISVLAMGNRYPIDSDERLLGGTYSESFPTGLLKTGEYKRYTRDNTFSIALKTKKTRSGDYAGKMAFGGVQKSWYKGKLATLYTTLDDNMPGPAIISMKNIQKRSTNLLPRKFTGYKTYCDSTVSGLYLPADLYQTFMKAIGSVSCDSKDSIDFEFGGTFSSTKISVELQNMLISRDGKCALNIQQSKNKYIVIGTDALAYFYIFHDLENEEFTIGQSNI